MSDAVSALNNATYSEGIAEIREIGPLGMITLRGDLSVSSVRNAAKAIGTVDYPDNNHANCVGERGIAWMSPDELLIMCPYAEASASVAKLTENMKGSHALVVNVSDARAVFQISGPHAREVMAKLAPVDLDPAKFEPGQFRRTRMAQVAAAFWMRDTETFQIICFRSNAQYMFDLLKVAAQPGSEVSLFSA